MPRAKQRTPQLRARVLERALEVLAEAGPAGFTARNVAEAAGTSVPAVYELFGDKSGLLREVYFEGFRRLGEQIEAAGTTGDPRSDLFGAFAVLRRFVTDAPALADVMFSLRRADFDASPQQRAATDGVREAIVGRVRRGLEGGLLHGDPVDIAHVLLALAQGLATQESAGWLGGTAASVDRRWTLAFRATLDGFAPPAPGR